MTGATAVTIGSTSLDAASAGTLEIRTEPLGGSPISRAAQLGVAPPSWYPPVPSSPEEWRERIESVRRQFAAGAWLHLLEPAIDAHGLAAERLSTVATGAGVVVTTGQQPGLFGGPLYTLSKALSARALADALQEATGIPTAPIFWAATDDADFAEASRTLVSTPHGAVHLQAQPTAPEGTPMSRVPLGDDVAPMLEVLRSAAGSASWVEALQVADEAYRTGNTVGGAYVTLLRHLLEPLGIAVLDASHVAAREAGFHTVRRALLQAAEIEKALSERADAIRAGGFTPQVEDVPGLSLVFRYDENGRKARIPIAEARALVTRVRHDDLGPNVLLRPVVERTILPTVAYVAGPGELAYFAQVSAVASVLGSSPPLGVPRWSGTIIEPHVRRALERLGMAPDDLANQHDVERRVAMTRMPATAASAIDALRSDVETRLATLGNGIVPNAVIEGARTALHHRVDRLERRLVAALKKRDDDAARDLALATGALYPGGKRQERALNAVPLLARHGAALWDAMLAGARAHAASLLHRGRAPLRAEQ